MLIPLVRFLPPDDERVRGMVLAIADELREAGLVLRYRVDETDDGLSGVEGTFTICSFWLVSAFSEIGEPERAQALCHRLLGLAGPLDLYVAHVIADELAPCEEDQRTAVFSELRSVFRAGLGPVRKTSPGGLA